MNLLDRPGQRIGAEAGISIVPITVLSARISSAAYRGRPNRILSADGCSLREFLSMADDNLVQFTGGQGMITRTDRELHCAVIRLCRLTNRPLGHPPPN
jgi:hypothetical protein